MEQRKREPKPYPWRAFPFAGTVLKNLFSKPATVGYPFEPAHYPERMRGHVEIRIEDCISCGLCARNCPPGALKVDRAAGTWTINRFDCVQCGNLHQCLPQKVSEHCAGLHHARHQEGQRDLHRPKAPDAPAAGTAGGKPENDSARCVYCTLCAKKCPQGAITVDRAAKSWKLDAGACVGLRNLRRLLPEKVPDAEVRKVPSSQHKTGRPGEKVSRTGRFF